MSKPNIEVELSPFLQVTWPSGQVAIFSPAELAQLIQAMLIEGLLALQGSASGQILREMDLELGELEDGTLVLRPTVPARLRDLLE